MSARKLGVFAFVIGTGILGQQAHAENCFELLADDAAFDACSARQDERRLGKYFCFVTYTAGIQYPTKPDGTSDVTATPYIGSIKSKSNKFFMEVQKNPASKPTPCVSKKTMEMACTDESAPFILTSKSDDIPSSAFGYNTSIFRSYQNTFLFNGDFSFAAYMGYQNSYLTHGKCEKIN